MKGTNTSKQYQNAMLRYGKQSFGMFGDIFKDSIKKIVDNFKMNMRGVDKKAISSRVDKSDK